MPSPRPVVRKLRYIEAKRVEEVLHKHCWNVDGYSVFEPGFNDERVAQIVKADYPDMDWLTPGQVANMRYMVIGKRSQSDVQKNSSSERLSARVAALEKEIPAMIDKSGNKYVSELGSRVTRLESRLRRLSEALGEHFDD